MKAFNSTLKPSKPLQRKTPLRNSGPKKGKGLAQRIAESLGKAIQHARGESNLLRSEAHRRNVAALPCAVCRIEGFSQAAHINFGKAKGRKNCDSLTFPLCADRPGVRGCHSLHDQGAIHTKEERVLREWEMVDTTRATLMERGLWSDEVGAAYRNAIVPISRFVHGEKECPTSVAADSGVAHSDKE